MRLLRAADYRRMPWKNGGGETIEMMVSPADASLETFDWRISMAHVAKPGSFSLFPGIDRTLAIIGGAGITLNFQKSEGVSAYQESTPFSFSGDLEVNSSLIDGPIDDLNIMSRRGRYRHSVRRNPLASPTTFDRQGDTSIAIAFGSSVDLVVNGRKATLAQRDAAVFDAAEPREFTAIPNGQAELFLIEMWCC